MFKACHDLQGEFPDVWEWSWARVRFAALRRAEVSRARIRAEALEHATGVRMARDQSEGGKVWAAYVKRMTEA